MFQYRQVLVRLRAGDSERDIARSGLMGREKAAKVRVVATERGWLDLAVELPDDTTLAAAMVAPRKASSCTSSAEPWRELVPGVACSRRASTTSTRNSATRPPAPLPYGNSVQ